MGRYESSVRFDERSWSEVEEERAQAEVDAVARRTTRTVENFTLRR